MKSSVTVFFFWNGNCWLCWGLFINGLSFALFSFFLLSEGLMESFEPPLRIKHSKWFAPICEGATFGWRLITTSVSRPCNLFLLDERKSNRGVQMCRGSSQPKVKLIVNTRKDNLPINFCWNDYRQILSYNLSMRLKSMLSNLDSWSVTLGNVSYLTNILLLNNQSRDLFFPRHAKSRCISAL